MRPAFLFAVTGAGQGLERGYLARGHKKTAR